jgi:hypothetical protein
VKNPNITVLSQGKSQGIFYLRSGPVALGLAKHWSREKADNHQNIETLYVDRPQKTTLLLSLLSTDFYPDGNSPGKTPWKIVEDRTLKAGSSPPSRGGHIRSTRSITSYEPRNLA